MRAVKLQSLKTLCNYPKFDTLLKILLVNSTTLLLTGILVFVAFSPAYATSNRYWFQVGAYAANGNGYGDNFGISITGASVEIRVNTNQHINDPQTALAYWVGIDLPENSFIQVGYIITTQNEVPHWYWEYFHHNAVSSTLKFNGAVGVDIGPNGTWYDFSIQASGTIWTAYVNNSSVGSIDLGVTDSEGSGPYAVAEAADVTNTYTVLGPVEFRNLQYRDLSGSWHSNIEGTSLVGYGVGSATTTPNPYGIVSFPNENNYWVAGSNLNQPEQGQKLWPWHYLTVQNLTWRTLSNPSGWYVDDFTVNLANVPQTIPLSQTTRQQLNGWYANGLLEPYSDGVFSITQNMTIAPNYVQQSLVQVKSSMGTPIGAGWYNDGATANITMQPDFIPMKGILGGVGLGWKFVGWQNDPISFEVNAPVTLVAVWQIQFSSAAAILLPALFGLGVMVLVIRRLISSEDKRTPYQTRHAFNFNNRFLTASQKHKN